MPAERYYYPKDLQEGNSISLEDMEFHHLVNVMRNRVNDLVEVVNGNGQLANGKITRIEKKHACIDIDNVTHSEQADTPLILVQGIPRLAKLEWIVEKATELGMTELWLYPASRTEKKTFSSNQLERLHTLLIAAMKQCGRLFLPELIMMPAIKEWKNFPLPAYFGDTNCLAPTLQQVWQQQPKDKGSIFCVGPEAGFTEEEEITLKRLGAIGTRLNPHILRTETAAIAAISLISHWQQ